MSFASAVRSCRPGLVTVVPGFGATPAWESLGRPPFCYHEEIACGLAHGAALVGVRAATLMKTHGLLKAANQVSSSLSCGVRAGLVHLVFEDPEAQHSDNVLQAGPFLDALGMPWLEAGDAPEATLPEAFARSERLGLPVAWVVDGRTISPETPEPMPPPASSPSGPRDPQRHLVSPFFAGYQHQVLQARLAGRPADSVPRPPLPPLPGLPAFRLLEPFLEVLREVRPEFVAGDATMASASGLPPYGCVDAVTCIGGSLPMALGALAVGLPEAWAVVGDFSFLTMGPLALLEAVHRGLPLKVILVSNGIAAATGGQAVDSALVDLALAPYASQTRRLAPGEDPRGALGELRETPGLRILVVEVDPGAA